MLTLSYKRILQATTLSQYAIKLVTTSMYLFVNINKSIIITFLLIKIVSDILGIIYNTARAPSNTYEMFVPVRSLQFASNLQHSRNLHLVITSENSRLCLYSVFYRASLDYKAALRIRSMKRG
jgi:hypothetical protein